MGDLGQQQPALDAAAFELTRFEWDGHGRLELEGVWSGVRGTRFMRPTLVLGGHRALATLEHKPWDPAEGEPWVAAFEWANGAPEDEAELSVAPGIEVDLPAPTKPGTKPSGAAEMKRRPGKRVPEEPTGDAELLVRIAHLERERDQAVAERREFARELEELKQSTQQALSEAREREREALAAALSEGAELRGRIEEQRAEALALRDTAFSERDEARVAQVHAEEARDRAVAERKAAERDRDRATKEAAKAVKQAERERDRAREEAARAASARDEAATERDRANAERDLACQERDALLSAHERGLPLREPQPRYGTTTQPRSPADIWFARAIAIAIVAIFALVVLALFL